MLHPTAILRQLLQQQPQDGAPPSQAVGACVEQLGGISVGGWITLSLIVGALLGALATLGVQAWRRRRELRYMDKGPGVRRSLPMQAMPPMHPQAPRTPLLHANPAALPPIPSGAAAPGAPAATTAATAAAAAAHPPAAATVPLSSKYFSPLNTNKSVGSVAHVHAQLSELRSSVHLSDSGGDTRAPAASDQHAARDKAAAGSDQVAAGQRPREFSQHGMRLQQNSGWPNGAPPAGAPGGPVSGQADVQQVQTGPLGHQLPQEISSSVLSDMVLQAEDSSPYPSARPVAPSHLAAVQQQHQQLGAEASVGPRSPAQLPAAAGGQQLSGTAAPGGAAAATDAPRSGVRQDAGPQQGGAAQRAGAGGAAHAGAAAEIEDEYEDDDLDDDWRALLGGVDERLRLQGARPLNARERAVAIKRLLVATGTRGVEFALNTALQEVLSFRRVHGTA